MTRSNKKKNWYKPPIQHPTSSNSYDSNSSGNILMQCERDVMLSRAVASASRHGLVLSPGKLNQATGNCAFEAAIYNVTERPCFEEKLLLSPDYYRRIWVTDMKNRTMNDETWKIYSDSDWEAGWKELMESGVYERGIFGDLMLFGISCGLRKILLIFNTNLNSPHDPIYVCHPRKFGVEPDTNIPVVLAYNMSHYESLHPCKDSDVATTVTLVDQYLTGTYPFAKKDLPFLLDYENFGGEESSEADQNSEPMRGVDADLFQQSLPEHLRGRRPKDMGKEEKKEYNKFRKQIPKKCQGKPVFENESPMEVNNEYKCSSNATCAKIKIKDMTPEQYKEYKSSKQKEARRKESNEQSTSRKQKDKAAKATKRKQETIDESESRKKKDKEGTAAQRQRETTDEIESRRKKEKQAKTKKRVNEKSEEAAARKKNESTARAKKRALAKSKPTSMYSARNAKKVLYGEQIVPELKDSKESIGSMNVPCDKCGALKWKNETSTVCCNNGKVDLPAFPNPPPYLQQLWTADSVEARLFREHTRPFNNALALSSVKVSERNFKSNYKPSVVFEGKVCQMFGPLMPEGNEPPRFAQLYIHDPATQNTMRIKNMNLPTSLSSKQIDTITKVMSKLQNLLAEVNPYVKDFKHICEIPEDEIKDGILVISCKALPKGAHERTYNKQTSLTEVSVLTNSQPGDLVLRKRGGGLQFLYDIHPSAQPLHFTVLFPLGTNGYSDRMQHAKGDTNRRVTPREFFAYHLNMRDLSADYLFRAGRLFQEYVCIAFTTIQSQKLKFHKQNQTALRADTYKNVKDVLSERVPMDDRLHKEDHQLKLGRRIILPRSFIGSPRWYNSEFQDGMAICREYHKPDFFITMTCNPHWEEIKAELRQGENVQDRPDLVARVFKQKKDQLIKDISSGKVLGNVPAILWVIEFQKRGLPHVHVLVILSNDDRPSSREDIDDIICAELPPDPEMFKPGTEERIQAERLELIVLRNMVHGPCGKENPESPCMNDGKCSKKYPKQFCRKTVLDPDNVSPEYQRLAPESGGRSIITLVHGKEYVIDNRWIVPYSPMLSLRFNCHTNIEICYSPTSAKYLYKYLYKGEDRAMVRTEVIDENKVKDEISDFEDLRSVGSSEAAWQIFNFNITKKHPAVYSLRCHLEGEHHVVFDENSVESVVEQQKTTELTGFFAYNHENPGTMVKYVDFPKKCVWKEKEWRTRKAAFDTIGRVHSIHPAAGDVFYLRMLLHHDHCMGKMSFDELRTVNGEMSESYQEICRQLGLLQDDNEWDEVLKEGSVTKLSSALRELFTTILLFSMPANPKQLFEDHFHEWADDYIRDADEKGLKLTEQQLRTLVLIDLKQRLQSWERELTAFGLKEPTQEELDKVNFDHVDNGNSLLREELNFDIGELRKLVDMRKLQFTESQRDVYESAIEAVEEQKSLLLFIDARGGTGKTFVLNAILAAVRTMDPVNGGCVALAVGTTGIAANLLHLGRTFHSRFKAPLSPHESSLLSINAQSKLADLIKEARIIVIDEAPMLHKHLMEAMDRTLMDIMNIDEPFGGKTLILSGDFRQTLPVIPGASSATVIDSALNRSFLWKHFKVLQLKENMRVKASGDQTLEMFDRWTLSIGDGTLPTDDDELIEIPEEMCMEIVPRTLKNPNTETRAMQELADHVYPNLGNSYLKKGWMDGRAILAPTNKQVDEINNLIADFFPGHPHVLTSSDELINPDDFRRFNTEYLNTLAPSGLPAHRLFLKTGMPLMLIRNLNPKMGLCNGTKLIFNKVHKNHLLECTIAGGEFNSRKVLIPRITLKPKDREFSFEWSRRQFPVRVCFAMTINKSQGQTLQNIGIWLNDYCFAHGQLYVAVSRVGSPSKIKFAIKKNHGSSSSQTRNVVFKEVFSNIFYD